MTLLPAKNKRMNKESLKNRKHLDLKEAKIKAADYCAYQERSQHEVRKKLYTYGLYKDDVEEILADLIIEGYINEERFATAYVGGKFRMKQWGKNKILQGLRQHKISEYCIKIGFKEIDPVEYLETLKALLHSKAQSIKDSNDYSRRNKLMRYAIAKGYEASSIYEVMETEGI